MCISYCTDGLSWINHKFPLKSENWFPILGGMGWIFLIPSPEVIKGWQGHLVTYLVNIGLPMKSTLTHGRIWQFAEIGPAEPQNRGLNPPTAFTFHFPPPCLHRQKLLDSLASQQPKRLQACFTYFPNIIIFCFFYIIFKKFSILKFIPISVAISLPRIPKTDLKERSNLLLLLDKIDGPA